MGHKQSPFSYSQPAGNTCMQHICHNNSSALLGKAPDVSTQIVMLESAVGKNKPSRKARQHERARCSNTHRIMHKKTASQHMVVNSTCLGVVPRCTCHRAIPNLAKRHQPYRTSCCKLAVVLLQGTGKQTDRPRKQRLRLAACSRPEC
jgi:hypothetical protein